MKPLTVTEIDLVRSYIKKWDAVHDRPISTPGPDSLHKETGENKTYSKEFLDAEAVVATAIKDQWKEEHVSPVWMANLLVHCYRHGLELHSFKVSDDPKAYMPQGIVGLGYDLDWLLERRMLRFHRRLLEKIGESVKIVA